MLAGWLQVNHGPALAVLPEGEAALKGALEANFKTNVDDALLAALEEPPRLCQALALQVLIRRFAKGFAKQAMKVVRGKAGLAGNFAQVDLRSRERVHVVLAA